MDCVVSRDTLTLSLYCSVEETKRHSDCLPERRQPSIASERIVFIPLQEILRDHLFQSAEPVLLAGADRVAQTQVRWVHPSELLHISGLLHGDELLLTTGEALFRQRPDVQVSYLRSLVECGVAALAIEPEHAERQIPTELIDHAEQLGLPLYRLGATVPFIELAEKINRQIVSDHAATLQQADEISQKLAKHIASAGPNLTPLVEMISLALGVRAQLFDLGGTVITDSRQSAQPEPDTVDLVVVSADLFVGGDVAARLVLSSGPSILRERLELIADRLGSIVGLAYAQHYRPSPLQLASTALLQSIVSGTGGNFIGERAREAGIAADREVCLMVLQSYDMSRMRSVIERILHAGYPVIRTHLESHRLYALAVLEGGDPHEERDRMVGQLRQELAGMPVECSVGPVVDGIERARHSLDQALALESIASSNPREGRVRDVQDYAVERLLAGVPRAPEVEDFVEEQLGRLLAADRAKGGMLTETLHTWLEAGCNTTATAGRLYLERQTMHKRLTRIFALVGGDPRETGRSLSLHLACRLAGNLPRSSGLTGRAGY